MFPVIRPNVEDPGNWVQAYPAPVCSTCDIPMWLVRQPGQPGEEGPRRRDFYCGSCGSTLKVHRLRSAQHQTQ